MSTLHEPIEKFFRDRGTHLAAMIAYFALLSLVPLIFLALAVLGIFGRADESSYLVTELQALFPSQSISDIVGVVRAIQGNAATLGILGAIFLLWSSLSLFSALESAFNIVYERPNRPFLRGKALAFVLLVASLIVLFAGLVMATFGYALLRDFAPGFVSNGVVAYLLSLLVSTSAILLFLVAVYSRLTNAPLGTRDVLPGSALAAVLLQATFQVLPAFFRFSGDAILSLRALGTPVLLLIWLYVASNVIVLGAEVNWWAAKQQGIEENEAAGLA
ncbi:MAG TPA: YihY/virulence factor BrkB family protein [Gaiellaceae bacterium]|nr:YihY/virulence factor BrkB family protein [Gaiellaceae bacterium]